MKRKNFIATLLGGLVAAPVVAKAIVEQKPEVNLVAKFRRKHWIGTIVAEAKKKEPFPIMVLASFYSPKTGMGRFVVNSSDLFPGQVLLNDNGSTRLLIKSVTDKTEETSIIDIQVMTVSPDKLEGLPTNWMGQQLAILYSTAGEGSMY
ncbi:MAG: hypothetical protein EOO39_00490 [Cytophagaceae bacterium]|nr:MAG: hypothetical protein EOO39_00490 [Cytophagaceae bacterium]